MSEKEIEITNLRKTFEGGSIVAVDDIDLEISNNEFVVLLGPSGCGKTTILRCIAGLDQPDSGQIKIKGNDVTSRKPKDRDLAFVFQSIALFPHLKVRKNMSFGLEMKLNLDQEEIDKRVEDAAEILGISNLLDRRPSDLSGGQQQRVSLGRAMVMEPTAFLLDEPFSALDANLRDQMRTEIKKLQRKLETVMIFVTHDQEEAMTLGDKIVVMNDGKIQQIGSPHDIYNDPRNRFVAEFIGSPSTNMFECTLYNGDDQYVVQSDLFSLAIPENGKTYNLDDYEGESLTLGIRPERLRVSENARFKADVDVIEPQGLYDVVHISSNDKAIRLTSSEKTLGNARSIGIDFESEDVWLFDDSGVRLV